MVTGDTSSLMRVPHAPTGEARLAGFLRVGNTARPATRPVVWPVQPVKTRGVTWMPLKVARGSRPRAPFRLSDRTEAVRPRSRPRSACDGSAGGVADTAARGRQCGRTTVGPVDNMVRIAPRSWYSFVISMNFGFWLMTMTFMFNRSDTAAPRLPGDRRVYPSSAVRCARTRHARDGPREPVIRCVAVPEPHAERVSSSRLTRMVPPWQWVTHDVEEVITCTQRFGRTART